MQNTSLRRFYGGIPVLVTLLLVFSAVGPLPFFSAGSARAASLAEEHTVLYYLIEMQRRFKKNCGGEPMPEAPSLNPSAALRTLAMQSATSDQALDVFANANGLAGIPFLGAKIPSQNAQDAFERLNAAQCANLMNPAYRYIGAAYSHDEWILFMAGAEPASLPEEPLAGETPAAPVTVVSSPAEPAPKAVKPISPSVSTRPALRESRPQPAPSTAGGAGKAMEPGPASSGPASSEPAGGAGTPPGKAGAVDAPAAPDPQGSPSPASGAAVPAARPSGGGQAATPPASSPRTKDDPSPAPNVPVAEIPVDGTGRPIGSPKPLGSSGASGPAYLPAPAPGRTPAAPAPGSTPAAPIYVPPGGAGPVNDPAAPAAPVVVREIEVGPTGNISGPARAGQPASPGSGFPAQRPAAPPSVPPAQTAPSRPGVVPLHEQGAPVHPGGQGLLFPGQTGAASDARITGMAPAPTESGQLLRMVNQSRALGRYCGTARMPAAAPLRTNPTITAVAQAQADAMAAGGYFSSTSPQGVTLGQRVSASGYSWAFVAENIARVAPPVDNAVQSWMADQGQCANLMSVDYVDVGIGHNALNNIWVLTLAAPMPESALRAR